MNTKTMNELVYLRMERDKLKAVVSQVDHSIITHDYLMTDADIDLLKTIRGAMIRARTNLQSLHSRIERLSK